MSRAAFQASAVDRKGNVLPGSTIDVFKAGTVTRVSLFDLNDDPISNPFNADSQGFFQFFADPAFVDVIATHVSGVRKWDSVLIADETATRSTVITRDTVTQLRALPGAKPGLRVSTAGRNTAGDGGACDYVIEVRDGSADHFLTEYLNDGVHQARFLRGTAIEDVTVLIPSRYADLQSAVDDLYGRLSTKPEIIVRLNIISGHAITRGLKVFRGDYSFFRIQAQSAEVMLSEDFPDNSVIVEARNAKAPVLATVFNGEGVRGKGGYYLYNSQGNIAGSGYGVKNIGGTGADSDRGAGLFVGESSSISGRSSAFTGNKRNVWVTKSSQADIEGSDISGAVGTAADDANLFVSRSSMVHFSGCNLSGAARLGIRSWRSVVTGLNCNISNNGTKGADIREGSTAIMRQGNFDNNGSGALLADRGSTVDVKDGSFLGGSDRVIEARECSRIDAVNAIVNGGANCVYAGELSIINFENGSAINGTFTDLNVVKGGQIHATGATTSDSTGTPDASNTNVSSFNSIDGPRGIIWANP